MRLADRRNSESRRRSRRFVRGVAMAEAAISLIWFVMIFVGTIYFHDSYKQAEVARTVAYSDALRQATNSGEIRCDQEFGILGRTNNEPRPQFFIIPPQPPITRAALFACSPPALPTAQNYVPAPDRFGDLCQQPPLSCRNPPPP